jgi:transcriptional regulator with XRE-family HTH domain
MATGTKVTKALQNSLEALVEYHRGRTGLSHNAVAKAIGITPSALSSYQSDCMEAGINPLCKIADYFNVSTDSLLGRTHTASEKDELLFVSKFMGLDVETLYKLRGVMPPMRDVGYGSGETHFGEYADTVNAIVRSDAFIQMVMVLYATSDIESNKALEYNEQNGRVSETQINPTYDQFRLSDERLISMRDIYKMRYEQTARELFDEVLKVLDAKPKPHKPKGFTIKDGKAGPLELPPKMKYRAANEPIPPPPTATQEEYDAAQKAIDDTMNGDDS